MQQYIEWGSLANVVVVGLLVGAGLPTLFSLGVRALAGTGARDGGGRVRPVRRAAAIACFATVVLAVAGAIAYIAAGGH